MAEAAEGIVLDYSAQSLDEHGIANVESGANVEAIDSQSFGTRTGKGQFVLKDLEGEVHSILEGANEKKSQSTSSKGGVVGSSLGAISGLFRNVIGGKVLTKEDLAKPMRGMEEHLLNKNVAREAAVRLCEGVERELIGVTTGSFESISTPSLPLQAFPAMEKVGTKTILQAAKPQSAQQWNPPSGKSSPPQPPSTSSAPSYPSPLPPN